MCVRVLVSFFFFLPLSLLLLYLFLPLIKEKKKIITVLAGASSLPFPPSWQLANPARDAERGERRMLNPGTLFNPMQQKWKSSQTWLSQTQLEKGVHLPWPPTTVRECLLDGYF